MIKLTTPDGNYVWVRVEEIEALFPTVTPKWNLTGVQVGGVKYYVFQSIPEVLDAITHYNVQKWAEEWEASRE